MSVTEIVQATRAAAALFDMTSSRGRLEVRGADRLRWLDGMISRDVEALAAGEDGSGCYATLLTHRGAIIADLHVARLGEVFTLESLGSEIPRIHATLERFIIADDVELVDVGAGEVTLGLEGPRAPAILAAALDRATALDEALPKRNDWRRGTIGGRAVLIGAFGFSGEAAYQIRMAAEDRSLMEAALEAASGSPLVRGDGAALEVLRVEAGIPALGQELDEDVLPPEAHLDHAISKTKGCYVGQEIVARLRARGQVNHLLVGIRLDSSGSTLPAEDTKLSAGGKKTGEITSAIVSPSEGPIALGYVRREHAEPGTTLDYEGGRGTVSPLPFVALGVAAEEA